MKIRHTLGVALCLICFSIIGNAQYSAVVIQHSTGGQCNGIIELQWAGAGSGDDIVIQYTIPGRGDITYTWDNGQPTYQIAGLCAGEFNISFLTAAGCRVTLTTNVGGPGCFINNETLTPNIRDQCGTTGNGRIILSMSNHGNYHFSWSNGESSPITGRVIDNLFAGTYCVTITALDNPYCTRYECYDVGYVSKCKEPIGGVFIVNELKKGFGNTRFNASGKEYIEVVIAGNGTCDPVDLRRMIVDDNNGDFSNPNASSNSTGISQGHIRFKDIPRWLSVEPGSVILIYNSSGSNSSFDLDDDPADSNGDHVYILPHTDPGLEGSSDVPTTVNPSYADASYGAPLWDYIDLKNSGDAIQLRYSDGSYCHGFSYGKANKMSGGPDDLLLRRDDSSNKVFKFNNGDFRNETNYQVDDADVSTESPGSANNSANAEYTEQVFCDSLDLANEDRVMIVNEFSNGDKSGREYIELLVTGNSGECDTVDIRGFIIDDNNGDFSRINPGGRIVASGLSAGHIRFAEDEVWRAVPVGAIILIYNIDDINTAIFLDDDPTDENEDYVYVIPSNHSSLEGQKETPSVSQPYNYDVSYNYATADWKWIWGFNKGDAIQVRNPEGVYVHGISFGNVNGGVDDLNVHSFNGADKFFAFSSGSVTDSENFEFGRVADGDETPGTFNSSENETYILGLCEEHPGNPNAVSNPTPDVALSKTESFHTVYPNPFRDELIIEYEAEVEMEGELLLVDMLGHVLVKEGYQLRKGMNKIQLEFDNSLPSGIYNLQLRSDHEILGSSIVSCIKN